MYVTVFRSRKRAGMDAKAYSADAARMEALARTQPGFISFKSFAAQDGETVSISEWDSAAHARAWGRHPDHAAVQARGRTDYYDSYATFSADVPKMRRFTRED